MQEQLRKRIKRRSAIRENAGILLALLVVLGLAVVASRLGLPQKWHAAIIGTVVPFAMVIMGVRVAWSRWSFWASLVVCLALHIVAIWVFFQQVLSGIQNFGTVYWFPVAFVEGFVLVIIVKRVEEKLTGKDQYYKLSW